MGKFKIGEKVIVGRFSDGYKGLYWNPKMDKFVGRQGNIYRIADEVYYMVIFDNMSDRWCWYPETALKSCREEKLKRLLK